MAFFTGMLVLLSSFPILAAVYGFHRLDESLAMSLWRGNIEDVEKMPVYLKLETSSLIWPGL